MSPLKRKAVAVGSASVLALATPFVAGWEGLRTDAYYDAVGVATICYGHTKTAKMGQKKTKDECIKLLEQEIKIYVDAVDEAVLVPMKPPTHAAFSSFAYNVGIGAFKRSTLLKKMNAGNTAGACGELLKWNFAGGKVLRGLTRRREAENKLCMMGL